MKEYRNDLFLDYSRTDAELVQLLASELSDAGIRVWFGQWELVPGQDETGLLEEAIEQSRAIGVCVGRRRSGKLDDQILRALLSARQANLSPVAIPILLPGADANNIPSPLVGEAFVDFTAGIKNHQEIGKIIATIFGEEATHQLFTELEEGDALRDIGDLQEALDHFEKALVVAPATFGPKHPLVASTRNRIGGLQQELGDLEKARQEFEQALAVDTSVYGNFHSIIARDLNNLGSVLADLGEWTDAQEYYVRALSIAETRYGLNDPRVATIRGNLGLVLKNLGDLAGARAAFEQALAIDKANFGPDDSKVATDIANLGGVMSDLGKFAEAKTAFKQASEIFIKALGADHPLSIIAEQNLSTLLLTMKGDNEDYEWAEESFQENLSMAPQIG